MENKINIAELLKDCPKGMELDCTMVESLEFDSIVNDSPLPIRCRFKNPDGEGYDIYNFTKYGCWNNISSAKCVIFPKGKITWEGFQRPLEDGDILATNDGKFIAIIKKNGGKYYCCCHTNGTYFVIDGSGWFDRLATEEEKQILFDAIKANGYCWDVETKALVKLIEPYFKVGDRIKSKEPTKPIINIITQVYENYYELDDGGVLPLNYQDNWELVPKKFDITTLKPFDKVLARCSTLDKWSIQFFEKYDKTYQHPFICMGYNKYKQCIPYEGNEHLHNTTNNCDDFYKTWEK